MRTPRKTWDKLPADLQADFEAACKEVALVDQMAYLESSNPEYLAKFEKSGMQIFVLSQGDMKKITVIADGIVDQQAAADAFYARVLKAQRDFKAGYRTWEKWGDFRLYGGE